MTATVTYSFVCIDVQRGAILSNLHALILTACDHGVPLLVTGRDAECTAYIRLLGESLEDSVYNMMSHNTAQGMNHYSCHTVHMYLAVLEGCHKRKVCLMCPFVSCTTVTVYPPRYNYSVCRCYAVSCTVPRTYFMCLGTLCAF